FDGLDDVTAEVAWMRCREADAFDARNFCGGGKQFGKRPLFYGRAACRIFVGIYVLAEQLNFRVAEIGHLAGFGENGIRSPAALCVASGRHETVGGALVTSFDDRDVAAVRIAARGTLGLEGFGGLAIG